ncbi:glycine--tRNA ligase subunit beta [Paroceanicella profunda]|uniref:Glycine--tRNA ligase beta subunit n=1 Tax=Paroceanicella profunda TaxID=2579971 RepID=A0A5B8FVG7_9RHOB|nr:glycine--tRNA ligase subunit beta [Paroceanicella profunda]QDL92806.1 glycine--tRNA ligase subunit beta [Paroceanicella profunda]
MADLLIELFSEEIPARMQAGAVADLRKLVTDGLVEAGLTYASAAGFATPRRLTLALQDLPAMTRATREERKGPRTDAPEKALEGFLRSTGLTKDQLVARDDKKGQVWFAVIDRPGRPAEEVIAEVLEAAIRTFPWPKSMRWGAGTLRWVRPLHSILCILSDEAGARVVPLEVDGIRAGATTEGHRFMAPGRFSVTSFEDYEAKLTRARVMLNPEDRAEHIWADASAQAFAQGLELVEDKALLAEVSGLVEFPVVLMGEIREAFLGLPPEVLQTSMREHQKFFSVRNPKTGRIEKYVTVANRETADNGATILHGNGKVLAARLSDAKFFWENDLRTVERQGLEAMAAPLFNVTFHNRLGSQGARVERLAILARTIAPLVGADPDRAAQAAKVAKADLCSEMVYEFPELQGLMGSYYARHAGLAEDVAAAAQEHYSPLGPSDAVPKAPVSVAVALADKIDTLAGFWAIDEKPTGSKDPYALRRAALGVIRLILDNGVSVPLGELVNAARDAYVAVYQRIGRPRLIEQIQSDLLGAADLSRLLGEGEDREQFEALEATQEQAEFIADRQMGLHNFKQEARFEAMRASLLAFFADRLKVHLRGEGVRHDILDACFALGGQDDLVTLIKRVKALQAGLETEEGANLLAGYKRANNILTAEEKKDGVEYSLDPNPKFAESAEEKALFAALDSAEPEIARALQAQDFAAAMTALATLRAPIDAFFDKVVVNSDNQIVRRNRLCLLHRVRKVTEQVAVLSAIEG